MDPQTALDEIVAAVPDEQARQQETQRLVQLAELPRLTEPNGHGSWEVVVGAGILFSAPHEATQVRDGKSKTAERGTAALAFGLARLLGASAIATVDGQLGDPNWDVGSPYVHRASTLAVGGQVIDIHMMQPRGVELCVGLGPEPALTDGIWQPLVEEAVNAGLRVSVNWPFSANARTVTSQLQQRGNQAVQVELSWECFDPSHLAMARAWSALGRAAVRIAKT